MPKLDAYSNQLKSKLLRNFGANAYGQLITVVTQLAGVPLFLYFWGVELYGEWLILSAIPAYLSLSDIGFASVAANDMTMRMAKKDKKGTLEVYQSIWIFICGISIIVGCGLTVLIESIPLNDIFSISNISIENTRNALIAMMLYVLIGLQIGVLSAAFRSVGRYAFGTMINNTIRLTEWLASIVALGLGGSVFAIAMTMLAVRFTGLITMWVILRGQEHWLKLGFKEASVQKVRDLFKPAVAFMAFPLGLAFSLQGVVLLIGTMLGPVAVVIFSTYRTLTRLLVQFITVINQAIWPEISAAYGAGKMDLVVKLHRKSSSITFWVALIVVLVLWLMGNWVISVWTNDVVEQNSVLLFFLLLTIFLNVLWQTSWVTLMATNMHQRISIIFILCAVAGLLLSALLVPIADLNGVGFALVIVELPLLYFAINSALKLLNDNWVDYVKAVISSPFYKKEVQE